jgi:hypothetical protein
LEIALTPITGSAADIETAMLAIHELTRTGTYTGNPLIRVIRQFG